VVTRRAGIVALALAACLVTLAPTRAAAQEQAFPWHQLVAAGDTTGLVRTMNVDVKIEDGFITATIDEHHFNGNQITLTMRAQLDDLNIENGSARESNRAIHPHLGVVTFRCRGDAECVQYSTDIDFFFELPGPRVFGFFVQDPAAARQALADLQRLAEGR
jgi:hypothetical protein